MIEMRRKVSLLPPQPVPVSPQPLRDGPMAERPAAAAAETPYYSRHYASNALDSRLPGVLGDGEWKTGWSAPTPAELLSIARVDRRIVCQWPGVWRLYASGGKQIQEDYCGQSPIVADPGSKAFQLITATSSWEVRLLETGELAFQNALPYDENYAWPVLFRTGNRMLAFASIRPAFRHGGQEKGSSLLQLMELATPVQTDASKLVQNLTRFESLAIGLENAIAAAEGDVVAVAAQGVLLLFDSSLQVKGAYAGDFAPHQMSLDESKWVYLVVESAGKKALWVVTPDGVRAASSAFPPELGDLVQPPILGFDRKIYLLSASRLAALTPRAQVLWIKEVPGGSTGAGVTVDGRVLVAAGSSVLAFDAAGAHRLLHQFDERITTPPVYTAHHEILVGAGAKLYCLVRVTA